MPDRLRMAAWRALAMGGALSGMLQAGMCSAGDGQPRHDFQFFAGYSPAVATLIGVTGNRSLALAGFAYSYRCWIWDSLSLSYTAAAMPAAILIEPSHAVYGFAVAPLGFTLQLAERRRVHPFIEMLGGVIASSEPIPINAPNATGLNFLFDLGGGVRWRAGERGAVAVGYRFLHISNASTTSFNPGVDNNVIYLGYSFVR